jgi:hypothetical protein
MRLHISYFSSQTAAWCFKTCRASIYPIIRSTSNSNNLFCFLGSLDLNGTCIMYDPQFSTAAGNIAPWDHGCHGLKRFEKSHKCGKICILLGLDDVKVQPVHLRPRPRPKSLASTAMEAHVNADLETTTPNEKELELPGSETTMSTA